MALKYLAGDRLIGTAAERAAMTTSYSNIPQQHYKLLARGTLGSAGDVLDSGVFTAKENLMILIIGYKSGNGQIEDLTFNQDTGSNYARRYGENNGDSTEVSQDSIQLGIDSEDDEFAVLQVRNIANKEKLLFGRVNARGSTGAGSIGNRLDVAGKWANTSDQITRVTITNAPHSGDLNTDSEIVVLGYDDDESATWNSSQANFWQQLDSKTSTSDSNTTFTSNTFTAKKYIYFQCHYSSINNSGIGNSYVRAGASGSIDTGTSYAARNNINDGTDGTTLSQTNGIYCQDYSSSNGGDHGGLLIEGYGINVAGKEKLFIITSTEGMDGVGTAGRKMHTTGKWINTAAQFNILQLLTTGSAGVTAGELRIWGAN